MRKFNESKQTVKITQSKNGAVYVRCPWSDGFAHHAGELGGEFVTKLGVWRFINPDIEAIKKEVSIYFGDNYESHGVS